MNGQAGSAYAAVELPADFRKVVKVQHPTVVLQLLGDGRNGAYVTLRLIKIPVQQRNAGLGTELLNELIAAADRNGWKLALTPAGDFGCSAVRLEVFYRRFGFVANRGRHRDFLTEEAMIRNAQHRAAS